VCRSDGTTAVNITKSGFLERNPAWSPDGTEIVWTRFEDNQHCIWTMKSDGGDAKRITDPALMCSNPSWSPDRKRIAFATHRSGDLNFRVWQMNTDGSEPRELFKEMVIRTVYPAWSPDGKQILFGGAGSEGRVQLCICNSTGDGFAQLTHDAKLCSYAAWSPDGQYIAYVAYDRWPNGYSPWEADADTECPPGDLMLYDTLSGEHRKLFIGELPMYGPRPSWKPNSVQKRNSDPVGAK
jgi:Tol biopolymer transport system component